METENLYRQHVLGRVVEDTPEPLWRRLLERAKFTYSEAYTTVLGDLALVEVQRRQKLYQERYFKMEHALLTAARDCGISVSPTLIGTNRCHYVYAGKGSVGMTQSYVAVPGEMPSPASFRQQLAKVVGFQRYSRLDLGDEPTDLIMPKQITGILLHSPVGRTFTEDQQKLGAIGFFVPYADYSGWAAKLPLSAIISAYKPQEKREDRAAPTRKKIAKTGTGES